MNNKHTNKQDIGCKNNFKEGQLESVIDAKIISILGQPVRAKIIRFLAINGPSDISTIASNFSQDRSVISKHLKLMRENNILIMTKESKHSIYQLDGMEILFRLEDMVDNLKAILLHNCEEKFEKMYEDRINLRGYLEDI